MRLWGLWLGAGLILFSAVNQFFLALFVGGLGNGLPADIIFDLQTIPIFFSVGAGVALRVLGKCSRRFAFGLPLALQAYMALYILFCVSEFDPEYMPDLHTDVPHLYIAGGFITLAFALTVLAFYPSKRPIERSDP